MKTIHRYYLAAALCLVCCAACTDAADVPGADDGTLAGAIRFTATRPAPLTTRAVAGNDRWKGDGTEKIGVQLYKPGIGYLQGTYTITAPDGTATALAGDRPVFWPGKEDGYVVSACYPLPRTYDITDQSTPEKFRQADFLVTDEVTLGYTGSTPVGLPFRHALAKVRVELTGVDDASGEIKVGIWSADRIALTPGAIALAANAGPAYITACADPGSPGTGTPAAVAFEAMVPAMSVAKQDFLRITIGDREYRFTPDAASPGSFSAGRVYTYRVGIPSSNP